MAIPEAKPRKGLKNQDLVSGAIPRERDRERESPLHNLNVKGNKLGFHVPFPETPLTRCCLLPMLSSVYDPLGLAVPFILAGR